MALRPYVLIQFGTLLCCASVQSSSGVASALGDDGCELLVFCSSCSDAQTCSENGNVTVDIVLHSKYCCTAVPRIAVRVGAAYEYTWYRRVKHLEDLAHYFLELTQSIDRFRKRIVDPHIAHSTQHYKAEAAHPLQRKS